MFTTDRISTFLGAPPHHWKNREVQQVKHIHRCYRNAYSPKYDEEEQVEVVDKKKENFTMDFGDFTIQARNQPKAKEEKPEGEEEDIDRDDSSDSGQKDEEYYLPKDSPLRSKKGDKKAPMNPTFKDFEAFVNSCHFDFWREHFEGQSADKLLSDTAQTIVANVCNTQSRNELRVNNGNVPLRKKREHITPLALVLHELKLWATHQLRTASIYEEQTYKEIRYRINYLDSLAHKEVWGDTAIRFGSGMRAVAHDKLFRLFLSSKEVLERAEEYAYRGYCQRSSREKLHRLENLLKQVLYQEMKLISAVLTIDHKLEDPKTRRLNPSDLLNSIQNHAFVDYTNLVNVLLYELCQNPLIRAVFTAEYDRPEVKELINELAQWSQNNLFCRPTGDGELELEPTYLLDKHRETRILPEIYAPTAAKLRKYIKDVDPKAPVPVSGKKHVHRLVKAYESEEAAARVIRLVMKSAAAIQDLAPAVYAMHQLWILAGDGGDFTVYDTLRDHVISVMTNTTKRVIALQAAGQTLIKEVGHLCKIKEEAMKARALKTGKMKYKPAWVMNHKFMRTDLLPPGAKTFAATKAQLIELADDAWRYNLTTDQLNDKVEAAKKIFNALTGGPPEKQPLDKAETKGPPPINVKAQKNSWLQTDRMPEDMGFGTNNAFGDSHSESSGEKYNPFADDEDSDEY